MSYRNYGNGIGIDYTFKFKYPGDDKEYEYEWEIPFDIACEGIRLYCNFKDVKVDARDKDLYYLFSELNADMDAMFEEIIKMEEFQKLIENDYCREEAYDEWVDDYEYEHNLGKYADEDDDDEDLDESLDNTDIKNNLSEGRISKEIKLKISETKDYVEKFIRDMDNHLRDEFGPMCERGYTLEDVISDNIEWVEKQIKQNKNPIEITFHNIRGNDVDLYKQKINSILNNLKYNDIKIKEIKLLYHTYKRDPLDRPYLTVFFELPVQEKITKSENLKESLIKEGDDTQMEEKLYLYLFPYDGTTQEDIEAAEYYDVEYLGINRFEDEVNYVFRGTKEALEEFGDKWFGGYELHPDYLYLESDFAGDIVDESLTEDVKEEKWNIGSNKLVSVGSKEFMNLMKLAEMLDKNSPNGYSYKVEKTWEDYGADMEWYTVIATNKEGDSYQVLSPKQWLDLANSGDVEAVYQDVIKGEYFQDKIKENKELKESVNWDYFDKFEPLEDIYLPDRGEGENLATQAVTATTKLVYKYYNDGDVFDNQHTGYMDWCNDLSSYANWLSKYIPGASKILDQIFKFDYSDMKDRYEDLLKEVADFIFDEDKLKELEKQPKQGSIYDCEGDYELIAADEEDEDDYYWEYEEEDSNDEDLDENLNNSHIVKKKSLTESLQPGSKVKVVSTGIWEDKEGEVETIEQDLVTVKVDFAPGKMVRQIFNINELKEVGSVEESLKEAYNGEEVTVLVTDIEYETDGQEIDLPKEMKFVIEHDPAVDIEDEIANYISNETSFLVLNYDYEILVDESVTTLVPPKRDEKGKFKGIKPEYETNGEFDDYDRAQLSAYKLLKRKQPFAVIYAYSQGKGKIILNPPLVKQSQEEVDQFVNSFKRGKEITRVTADVMYLSQLDNIEYSLRQRKMIEEVEDNNNDKLNESIEDSLYNTYTVDEIIPMIKEVTINGLIDNGLEEKEAEEEFNDFIEEVKDEVKAIYSDSELKVIFALGGPDYYGFELPCTVIVETKDGKYYQAMEDYHGDTVFIGDALDRLGFELVECESGKVGEFFGLDVNYEKPFDKHDALLDLYHPFDRVIEQTLKELGENGYGYTFVPLDDFVDYIDDEDWSLLDYEAQIKEIKEFIFASPAAGKLFEIEDELYVGSPDTTLDEIVEFFENEDSGYSPKINQITK